MKKREREIQELKRHAAQAKMSGSTHGDYRSRSHTPEKCRGGSPRKKRDISPTPKKGRLKKHQRDGYKRTNSDWKEEEERRSGWHGEGTTTAHEAVRRALSQIAASPLSKRLQDARLPSRIKHRAFTTNKTNMDPVRHIQYYQQAMFMHIGDDTVMCKMFPSRLVKVALF